MSLNLLNSLDAITIVQNNVDALHTLTINSIDNLGSELEKRYTKTDTDILLSTKEKIFNVQAPLLFTSSDLDNKPTLTSDTYSKSES